MLLHEWLRLNKLTTADFATKIGGGYSPFAVGKWARGERIPRFHAMRRIAEATGGQVQAADFVEANSIWRQRGEERRQDAPPAGPAEAA